MRLTPLRLRQIWYVPLLGLAMGVMLARMLVMARLLDLTGFAQFSLGLLVSSTFCMLACLGLQPLLQREMPVHFVRRRERAAAVLVAQCLLVAASTAALLAAAVAGLAWTGIPALTLGVGLLHGLSQQVFVVATVESRSRGDPVRFARQNLARALVVLVAGAAVASLAQSALLALAAEALVSLALSAGVLARVFATARLAAPAAAEVGRRRLAKLPWRAAAALLALSVVAFGLANADRWIAARELDARAFAQYAFAWMVLMVAQSAQTVVNAAVFPMLARRHAINGSSRAFSVAARISAGSLFLALALAAPAWWLAVLAIDRAFPSYADSSPLIGVFIFSAAFRISDFWSSFLVITGREGPLLVANVAVVALVGGGWWLWLRWADVPVSAASISWLALLLSLAAHAVAAVMSMAAARRSPR
jgi:O-antigen/teichoic acid export membrane protein